MKNGIDNLPAVVYHYIDTTAMGVDVMASEAQVKASKKYNERMTTAVKLKLNANTDSDILKRLESQSSKSAYIKDLIRRDIGKG